MTNALSATTRTNALSAAAKVSRTPSTASNVRDWRRIGMAVRRLSIWAVAGPTYSFRRKLRGPLVVGPSTGEWAEAGWASANLDDRRIWDGLRKELRGDCAWRLYSSLGMLPAIVNHQVIARRFRRLELVTKGKRRICLFLPTKPSLCRGNASPVRRLLQTTTRRKCSKLLAALAKSVASESRAPCLAWDSGNIYHSSVFFCLSIAPVVQGAFGHEPNYSMAMTRAGTMGPGI